MSLSRFLAESNAALRTDSSLRSDDALELVRDKWLQEKMYGSLVDAVLANWTSANCVEFMKPLSDALLQSDQQLLHRKLWATTVKRQISSAFENYGYLKASKPTFDEVIGVSSKDFDEFDFSSYDDRRKATSFLMGRLLRSLEIWRAELRSKAWRAEEVDALVEQVRSLKKPKLSAT